jgi:hypothetical protein
MRRIRTNWLAGATYMSEATLPRGRFLQDRPQKPHLCPCDERTGIKSQRRSFQRCRKSFERDIDVSESRASRGKARPPATPVDARVDLEGFNDCVINSDRSG